MPEVAATQTDVATPETLTKEQVAQKLGEKRKARETVTPENREVETKKPEEIKARPAKAEEAEKVEEKAESEEKPEEATEEEAPEESEEQAEEEASKPAQEQEEEEQEPQDDLYDVKVNGKVETVTLEELKKSYSKAKGADARFEEAANMKKEFETQKQGFEQHFKQAGDHVIQLGQQLLQQLKTDTRYSPQEMESLRYTDVAEWNARKLEIQEKENLIRQSQSIAQQRKAAEEATKKAAFDNFAKEQAKDLVSRFKEFKNEEVRDKTIRRASDYLAQKGFSAEEIDGLVRANMWEIAINSMRYESAKSKISGVTDEVKKAPKMLKPGAKQPPLTEVGKLERELAGKQAELKKGGSKQLATEIMQLKRKIAAQKSG